MQEFKILVKTFEGLENNLKQEILDLGGKDIAIVRRGVTFWGDNYLLYKASMALRTALVVQVPIAEAEIENENDLYSFVNQLPWTDIFSPKKTIAIDAISSGEQFKHSKYIALKTKDAIADHFRNRYGIRPSVDRQTADVKNQVHIYRSKCTILLSTSAGSLSNRGYRVRSDEAPMNEVLAAGILKIAAYNNHKPLYDPMCGTGTIGIEAALMALNRAPNLNTKFTFFNWFDFDFDLFMQAKRELLSQSRSIKTNIFSSDLSSKTVEGAIENFRKAQLPQELLPKQQDFFTYPKSASGLLIINPPYNIRLGIEEEVEFYKRIGDTLKQSFTGSKAFVLSPNLEAMRHFGLKPSSKQILNNGGIDCQLVGYDLY